MQRHKESKENENEMNQSLARRRGGCLRLGAPLPYLRVCQQNRPTFRVTAQLSEAKSREDCLHNFAVGFGFGFGFGSAFVLAIPGRLG